MRTLRMAVLSTARIGAEKVIPATRSSQRCEVVALASRERSRAHQVAGELGIPRVHDSYADLLADPAVDAVYIPLPNHLHAEWTVAAAEAGKHVLCEKPLALTADEARRMVAACQDAGVVFMEAYMYRLHPQWVKVREVVASGRLGDLQTVQTFFAYHNVDAANIRNVAEYGGGALLDIGCYAIDLSRMIFGAEPVRVDGSMRIDEEFGTDVLTSGLLEFPGGGQATFTCGTRSHPGQWVHVVGTEGRLTVEVPFNAPPDAPTYLTLVVGGEAAQRIELPVTDQYTVQSDAFAAAVLDGTPVPIPPEEGVAVMEVIDAVRESAAGASAGESQRLR